MNVERDLPPSIEAVPTVYSDVTFRSRLEAGWAMTLDSLNIQWAYEPEIITLPSGTTYIPDFWLPELGTWIEVKGPGVPRIEKATEFGEARACHCVEACTCSWPGGELVLVGHPPEDYTPDLDEDTHLPRWVVQRGAWRHGGHLRWDTAHGRGAWLAKCEHCGEASWYRKQSPLFCRSCASELRFARSMSLASPIPQDTTPRDEFGAYLVDEDDPELPGPPL